MCYTGICPYEDREGECKLKAGEELPADAVCNVDEEEPRQKLYEDEQPLRKP